MADISKEAFMKHNNRKQQSPTTRTRVTVRTSTQKEAADIARRIAINQQAERLIRRVTGEIRQKG